MRQPDQTDQIEVTARTPGRRALGAMAIAAHRANSLSEGATRPQLDLEGLLRSVPTESVREPDHSFIWQEAPPVERPAPSGEGAPPEPHERREPPGPRGPERERERWLVVAVAVVTVVVVLAAVTLAVLEATGHRPLAVAPVSSAPSATQHRSASTARSGAAHHKASRTSSSTVPVLTPGPPPSIASLSPKSGAAGQTITIAGSNFMSPSGHISAAFDGQTASIACPAPSTCTVTVPTLSGPPGPVKVTVTTDSGVSNSANFTYR